MKKGILSCITTLILLFGLMVMPASAFNTRTTAPSGNYWYNGSYNPYYSAGYSGECTWYVWGRAYEITGTRPSYYPGWGGAIWSNCQSAGYSCGSTPRVGSIMCTSGHVAIVESVSGDSMMISEYNWSVTHGFSTATLSVSSSSAGNYRGGQQIYGYVYLGNFDDTTAPTISNVRVTDKTKDGYTVRCHVEDNVGISRVLFPTWTEGHSGGEANWLNGTDEGNGEVSCRINTSDFGKTDCIYYTHIYAYDTSNNYVCYETISEYIDATLPTISNVRVTDKTKDGYTIRCHAEDNAEIDKVLFPTWTEGHPGDDANWLNGTDDGNGEFSCRISVSDFGRTDCMYYTHIYAYDTSNNYVCYETVSEYVDAFSIENNGSSADITNNGEERTATVIVADCDNDGVLQKVTASDITFAVGEKRTFMLGSGTHKIFVWDSLDGMKPLAEVE